MHVLIFLYDRKTLLKHEIGSLLYVPHTWKNFILFFTFLRAKSHKETILLTTLYFFSREGKFLLYKVPLPCKKFSLEIVKMSTIKELRSENVI